MNAQQIDTAFSSLGESFIVTAKMDVESYIAVNDLIRTHETVADFISTHGQPSLGTEHGAVWNKKGNRNHIQTLIVVDIGDERLVYCSSPETFRK